MTTKAASIRDVIGDYVSEKVIGRNAKVTDFSQASGGWSDEAYIFTLSWTEDNEEKSQGFVVRKAKKAGLNMREKNLYPQYHILDVLSRNTDLPIPKVYIYESDESVLGSEFFVMERLNGKSYVPWSKEGRVFFEQASKNEKIKETFVDYLAKLHSIEYEKLDFNPNIIDTKRKNFIDMKIKDLEDVYERYKFYSDPVVTDALEWLKYNKPNEIPLSIIHNDYRTGNLLYDGDQITGILDWEAAEIGDPRMDIAYVCAKSNRMDSPLMCYLLERDWFLSKYKEKTGLEFTNEDIYYFEVYHQLKFFMISLTAANAFIHHGSDDLRMARQGFRLTLMKNMLAELLGYSR